MKLAWKGLILAGIAIVVVAFGLDTTVDAGAGRRVHNIGLQGQQQMLLILGCVLFLAGVVLLAVVKLKQTPAEDEQDRAAGARLTGIREEWARKGSERVAMLESRGLSASMERPKLDRIGARISAGLFVGITLMILSIGTHAGPALGLFLLFLAIGYALWRRPTKEVIGRLMVANVIAILCMFGYQIARNAASLAAFASEPRLITTTVLLVGLPVGISLVVLWLCRRSAKAA